MQLFMWRNEPLLDLICGKLILETEAVIHPPARLLLCQNWRTNLKKPGEKRSSGVCGAGKLLRQISADLQVERVSCSVDEECVCGAAYCWKNTHWTHTTHKNRIKSVIIFKKYIMSQCPSLANRGAKQHGSLLLGFLLIILQLITILSLHTFDVSETQRQEKTSHLSSKAQQRFRVKPKTWSWSW